MLLKKIYSEPLGLFNEDITKNGVIIFKKGLNFIFAKKNDLSNPKEKKSLNSVGKSLLLNFIDFCLLSSESAHIKDAKKHNNINHYLIVLEFSINGIDYIIKRSLERPDYEIIFGRKDGNLSIYGLDEIKTIICDLIFKRDNYEGIYYNKWLRKIIPFFIKKQESKSKIKFSDPIKYIEECPIIELLNYHLFLLGIDNKLFYENYNITSELKQKEPVVKGIQNFISDSYGLKDINHAINEVDILKKATETAEENIKNFKLAKEYKNIEETANRITKEIKELWFQNHNDYIKIEQFTSSIKENTDISTIKIHNIYKDLNLLLAQNIKKTIKEAIDFRNKLSLSRKEFINNEINKLENQINERTQIIDKKDKERIKLFGILEAQEAIQDISEAYLYLNRLKDKFINLQGQVDLYFNLKKEITERKSYLANLDDKIYNQIMGLRQYISSFREIILDIHNALYTEDISNPILTFIHTDKEQKLNINISIEGQLSFGKNRGRTLIYDIAVLLNSINHKLNSPKFLIHDGIFDGIDKTHFFLLFNYLNKKAEEKDFQYIVTMNEEFTKEKALNESELVKIEENSIIIFTPTDKLLVDNR